MRTLVGGLVPALIVASVSWSLVLLGSGSSHGASLRLAGGVHVVLHHPGEAPHGYAPGPREHDGHEHDDHGGHGHHRHAADVPDDHVVAVSTDPASLRSQGGDVLPESAWSSCTVPARVEWIPVYRAGALVRVIRGPTPLPLHRSTTVLLI
jgi:hypothetical protein